MDKGNSVVTRKDGIAAINADWNWWKGIANALGGQVSGFTYRHAASIVLHDGQVIEVVGPVAEYIAETSDDEHVSRKAFEALARTGDA